MSLAAILEKIMSDAQREAEAVEARGRAEADGIRAAAEKEAAALRESIVAEAEERMRSEREKELSAHRLKLARRLLAVRRECLDDVFEGLAGRLIPESPEEYAALLVSLADESDPEGKAVLHVGRKDTERFGEGFADLVLQAFRKKFPGRASQVSPAPAPFDFGLVVQQQRFVHNLSLQELVAEARQEMEGVVAKALFAP